MFPVWFNAVCKIGPILSLSPIIVGAGLHFHYTLSIFPSQQFRMNEKIFVLMRVRSGQLHRPFLHRTLHFMYTFLFDLIAAGRRRRRHHRHRCCIKHLPIFQLIFVISKMMRMLIHIRPIVCPLSIPDNLFETFKRFCLGFI